MAKKVRVEAKNYTPSSQIIELRRDAATGNLQLHDPATGKIATAIELFKDTKFKSDENKDFKDERVYTSLEFRIIAKERNLILFDATKIYSVDKAATPAFTEVKSEVLENAFIGTDKALIETVERAIFPYLVLTVETGSGDNFKNDLASIKTDPLTKLKQKPEGDTFKAILEVDPDNTANLDLTKLRAFEGSKSMINPDGDLINMASSLGLDLSADVSWSIQAKFRGYENDYKGSLEV